MEFKDMSISFKTTSALNEKGYIKATEVQEKTIPLALKGEELVVRSQTGTGKTAIFGISLVESISKDKNVKGLVLTPTRELAMQITKEIRDIAKNHHIQVYSIYGGQGMREQIEVLRRNYDIIIATPGRLLDHARRGSIQLQKFNHVVLDEADTMLDIGFKPDIDKIMGSIPNKDQVLLFSATISPEIHAIARQYMSEPRIIEVGSEGKANEIQEEFIKTTRAQKFQKLVDILKNENITKAIIFVASKRGVEYVHQKLSKDFNAEYTHGGKTQSQRERIMREFKQGKFKILIATDVMARGIHVEDVSHVINYDKANTSDIHTHRIGRTGRMGKIGKAITLIETDAQTRSGGRGGRGGYGQHRKNFNFVRRFRR
jgi:ATP-dependent RNA helicase DeaD